MPKYRVNAMHRPGEIVHVNDKTWIPIDENMCFTLETDDAKRFIDAGWDLEPYDPVKHAHPFKDMPEGPKTVQEVLDLIRFESPEARDLATQAILLEAKRRLEAEEANLQAEKDRDAQVAAQRDAAGSMQTHHADKAEDEARATVGAGPKKR